MLRRPHARRYTRMMGRQNLPVLHAKPHPIDRMAYPVRPAHEAGSQFGRQQMRSRFLSTRLMGQRSLSILAHAAGGQFARNTCSHSLLPMAQSLLAHCPAISFMGYGGLPPCSPFALAFHLCNPAFAHEKERRACTALFVPCYRGYGGVPPWLRKPLTLIFHPKPLPFWPLFRNIS